MDRPVTLVNNKVIYVTTSKIYFTWTRVIDWSSWGLYKSFQMDRETDGLTYYLNFLWSYYGVLGQCIICIKFNRDRLILIDPI